MISDLDAERIPDVIDRASFEDEVRTKDCVDKVLRSVERAPSHFDGVHCIDCQCEIPEARLKTGAFRDVYCQTIHERMLRHRRS